LRWPQNNANMMMANHRVSALHVFQN